MDLEHADLAVIFITKNEEFHIGAAIDNVRDVAREVFVVDSGSDDATVAIATEHGAKVVHHKFEGFGAQWNFALSQLPVTSAWTMKMDPDERLSERLKKEIRSALLHDAKPSDGWAFDRVLWFMGKRLSGVKNEVRRIWRTGACRFSEVSVNEHPIINGKWRRLKGTMDHLDSRDLTHWLQKQNDYTRREALMRFDGAKMAAEPRLFGESLERRMWFKKMIRVTPGRFVIENLYNYFVRGAWRSGIAGWRWVKSREFVSRMIEYKYLEMLNGR